MVDPYNMVRQSFFSYTPPNVVQLGKCSCLPDLRVSLKTWEWPGDEAKGNAQHCGVSLSKQ